MSLMEIIVSALVLAGSSTAALQVWAQVGAAVQHAGRTEVQLEEMALLEICWDIKSDRISGAGNGSGTAR